MVQCGKKRTPRRGEPAAGSPLQKDWAEHLMVLMGVCEEYQSSMIALPLLGAASHREPSLAAVLQAPLAEMTYSHQALRDEVLESLNHLAALAVAGQTNPTGAAAT